MTMGPDGSVDVFCENCKYIDSYSRCLCKRVIRVRKIKTPQETKDVKVYASPIVDNQDNHCIYYDYALLRNLGDWVAVAVLVISVAFIIFKTI